MVDGTELELGGNVLEYQERVVKENEELEEKIKSLRTFLERLLEGVKVPIEEWNRLEKQLEVMREYARILRERIDNF